MAPSLHDGGVVVESAAMAGKDLFERRSGRYAVSDDADRFDVAKLHEWLASGDDQTPAAAVLATAAANSVTVGAYTSNGAMVAGLRILTDKSTLAVITDLASDPKHNQHAAAIEALIGAVYEHPSVPEQLAAALPRRAAKALQELGFTDQTFPLRMLVRRQGDPVVWRDLPDPREASVEQVADKIYDIVAAEGPVTAERVFKLYVKGTNKNKVTNLVRDLLGTAVWHLGKTGRVEAENLEAADTRQQVLRVSGTPPIVRRELGHRSLYEVPLDEVADLINEMKAKPAPRGRGRRDFKRDVVEHYGLARKSAHADQYLAAAVALATERREPKPR